MKTHSLEAREWYDSQGLWDHFLNRPCVGAPDEFTQVCRDDHSAVDLGDNADKLNQQLEDKHRPLGDDELNVLWKISHGKYIAFARMVEIAHGVE